MSNIKREKLVVIGNGIAGNSTVEQIIKLVGILTSPSLDRSLI